MVGLWPVRPPPLPGECMTSWLYRLAKIYNMGPVALINVALRSAKTHPSATSIESFDIYTPLHVLEALCHCTGFSVQSLQQLTLANWVPRIRETGGAPDHDRSAFDDYIRGFFIARRPSLTVDAPKRPWVFYPPRDNEIPICRACMLGDDIPYIRLAWKCRLTSTCPLHRVRLIDSNELTLARSRYRNPEIHERDIPVVHLDNLTMAVLAGRKLSTSRDVLISGEWWFSALRGIIQELQEAIVTFADDAAPPHFYQALFDGCGYPPFECTHRKYALEDNFGMHRYQWRTLGLAVYWLITGELLPAEGSRILTLCPPPDPLKPPYQCV